MKRVQRASSLLFLLMIACGGSSSETPMPLEPVPHSGPEPAASSRKTPAPEGDDERESESDDELKAAESPENPPSEEQDESEAPAAVSPDE